MAEENTVDLAALAETTSDLLKESRTDFETSLERVQEVIDDIAWWTINRNTLISEIGTVTFDSYESVKDLVDAVILEIVPTQDLLETDIQKSKKHVFISPSLDTAESKIVNMISSAGSGELKNLTGVFLSDAMRDALRGGQQGNDQKRHNDCIALLGRYQSADYEGNRAWLDNQFARSNADRDRFIYSTLFEMAQENIAWCFGQGIAIEQLHESFTARYNKLYMDITAANIAAYKAEVQGNIAEFEGKLRELDAQIMVEELKFSKDSNEYKLRIDQANDRARQYVSEYSTKIGTNLKLMDTRIQGGKNVADGYKAIYSAYSSQYSGVSLSNSSE